MPAVVAFSAAMFLFALFHPQDNVLPQLKGVLLVPTDFEDLYQFRRWAGSDMAAARRGYTASRAGRTQANLFL